MNAFAQCKWPPHWVNLQGENATCAVAFTAFSKDAHATALFPWKFQCWGLSCVLRSFHVVALLLRFVSDPWASTATRSTWSGDGGGINTSAEQLLEKATAE